MRQVTWPRVNRIAKSSFAPYHPGFGYPWPGTAGRETPPLFDAPAPRRDSLALPPGGRRRRGGAGARLRRRQEDGPAGQLSVGLRGHAAAGGFSEAAAGADEDECVLSLL